MTHYIDAERLKRFVEELKKVAQRNCCDTWGIVPYALEEVEDFICSLQQERPKVDLVAELKHHLATTPKEQLEKEWKELEPWGNIGPTVQEFLYGQQPEVELDREVIKYKVPFTDESEYLNETTLDAIAHHFAEWGATHLNARKSIWHNVAEEIPTKIGSGVIVACRNKNKEGGIWLYDLIQCWEGKWQPRENWETPVKWAYVRDLDNARKED